jgi:thioredoxin reductase (NADPH)
MSAAPCDVLIVGGGPAGMSAVRACASFRLSAVLIEGRPSLGGQLRYANNPIEDYVGVSMPSGDALAESMASHVARSDCRIVTDAQVTGIDVAALTVSTARGTFSGRSLVLAMGARPRGLGVPGEAMHMDGDWHVGLPPLGPAGEHCVVVGGGDNAADVAMHLARGGARVTLLVRGEEMRACSHKRANVEGCPAIAIERNTRITHFERDAAWIEAKGQPPRRLGFDRIFLRIGYEPRSDLVRGQLACDEPGFVKVDASQQTSAPRVTAVGDLVSPPGASSIAIAVAQAYRAVKGLHLLLDSLSEGGQGQRP